LIMRDEEELIEGVLGRMENKSHYTRGELRHALNILLNLMPMDVESYKSRMPTSVEDLHRGDVFLHKTFGGKIRPWIVLKVMEDCVLAVPMSSTGLVPRSVPSQCRLWKGHIGVGAVLIPLESARKEVTRPYTNHKHLDQVEDAVVATLTPSDPEKKREQWAKFAQLFHHDTG